MDTSIKYGLKVLVGAIGILDTYLGREATEKVLDAARADLLARGRPPSDEELCSNFAIAQAINERIQQA